MVSSACTYLIFKENTYKKYIHLIMEVRADENIKQDKQDRQENDVLITVV